MATVKVKDQICHVETLSEWIEGRIKQIESAGPLAFMPIDMGALQGRLAELHIIHQKINDGRIQEIGKVKFKKVKKS